MMKYLAIVTACIVLLAIGVSTHAARGAGDVVQTSGGDLKIFHLGHASLLFQYGGKVIYVDPFSKMADYSKLPKADLILLTHDHADHTDLGAIGKIRTDKTVVILTEACSKKVKGGLVMRNGDVKSVAGLKIRAVPAYNLVHKRNSGQPYHPKGRGNGYVITFGDKNVYVAGDTENTPEMKALKNIDVAFLPVNLPYTMTAEMVVDAIKAFRPKVLYPYHYDLGQSDLPKLKGLMKGIKGIELRVPREKATPGK
jgi:L-ascorbate metabolism protein UlaG (beta-lactamase superfamily)